MNKKRKLFYEEKCVYVGKVVELDISTGARCFECNEKFDKKVCKMGFGYMGTKRSEESEDQLPLCPVGGYVPLGRASYVKSEENA